MRYANIVIDNKSDNTDVMYTYKCGDEVRIGNKVKVPFARSRNLRTGYVTSLIDDTSKIDPKIIDKLKEVAEIDEDISLTEEIIRTCIWMRNRYMCRYIDAINCFTPSGRKAKRRAIKNSVEAESPRPAVKALNDEQSMALDMIRSSIDSETHDRFLIHGVTGSGKTEVYIRAAEAAVDKGRSVIILVPEISLTGQIVERFLGFFGKDTVAVLHSKLTAGERYDQWQRIHTGEVKIVIGARSAAFAPVKNLGLAVMDEEHEATYKSDQTPKYDTVEVLLKRLKDRDNQGVLILGSATPSVSTYSRTEEGIYKLIRLTKRYNDMKLPHGEIVDMREEIKMGNTSVLSRRMFSEMKDQLDDGKQIMLMLNRRGYSTFISCRECGYVAKCPSCGLSLTYHRGEGKMVCHYCGHSEAPHTTCPECGSKYIRYFGSGTEKIQEEVESMFPKYVVDRVDMDTVKAKGELKRKLKAFEKGKTNILIGTQLIAKGLDFKNVGLVGILSADVSLNIPDFRSPERAFQLITQAAGRAGRGNAEGKVIIQTYNPEHYAIELASKHDYETFFRKEIKFRKFMNYPPYTDLFQIIFTSNKEADAKAAAESWHERLRTMMSEEEAKGLFEPQEAYISKFKEVYRYSLIIRCPKGNRKKYSEMVKCLKDEDKNKRTNYVAVADVNPYSFA